MLVKFERNPFAAIDRMFDEVFKSTMPSLPSMFDMSSFRVDISEDDKAVHIEEDLPGVKKDDLKVTVEDNILTIRAERKAESTESKKNYYRTERVFGSLTRSFTLGENVNAEAIEAHFADGVLKLTLPKVEPVVKAREIAIK
ncbi:MAG: Hsp20/alpha crystallin family protein [Chloroherpetonaceae bacterium]|nr:Hsp20/alpha crystallin family protein [Chloroherpetonaceae bacterium]